MADARLSKVFHYGEGRTVTWVDSEVEQWIEEKVAGRVELDNREWSIPLPVYVVFTEQLIA
jgi:hypothetical protein